MANALTTLCLIAVLLTLCACRDSRDPERPQGETPPGTGGPVSAGDAARDAARGTPGAAGTTAATRPTSAATRPTSFTGTLRGSAVAIGGETTGWRLEGDGSTGGIDLDVSKVQQRAQALDGKRVNVSGRMTTRSWPERGPTQVLVAERIEEAPEPPVPGGR